jgi:hypothetical protein
MNPARRRRRLRFAVVAAGVVVPTTATAAWTPPQDVLPNRCCASPAALASNARGDAVAAFGEFNSLSIARASAHRRFGRRVRISSRGYSGASVAIDEGGVALIAFTYDDETDPGHLEGRGDDGCCTGVKVVVWRPGRRPTRPRAIFAPGTSTLLGAVAATRGRRGVLVVAERGTAVYGSGRRAPVQLARVRLDGRIGRLRTVANSNWSPTTLQWTRGRAVAGLMRPRGGQGIDLGFARQGSRGTFLDVRRFERIARAPSDVLSRAVEMTADGRGGQVAVWRRARGTRREILLGRVSLAGRLRATVLASGEPTTEFLFAAPAVARDRWIVVGWAQADTSARSAWVTTRSPRGRLVTRRTLGSTRGGPVVRPVEALSAAAAPGGGGAVSVDFDRPRGWATRIVGLRGGRPLPGAVLEARSDMPHRRTLLTGNLLDPARALFEINSISQHRQDFRVLESRLR